MFSRHTMKAGICALLVGLCLHHHAVAAPAAVQDQATVSRFAALALACVHKEYPNKIAHVLNSDADVAPPRELTPVFYGCFDWHSSVHGHWLLVRLLRLHPDADFAAAAEAALDASFKAEQVAAEVRYVTAAGRESFERPYGAAWLLQLTAELREWDDPRARRWLATLQPLESAMAGKMRSWLEKLSYPIRIGEHAQTAFAFGLFLDWAATAGADDFYALVERRSREFYLADKNCPLDYEPGGQDFLSPCLAEADLMRRLLGPRTYAGWLADFLPNIPLDGSSDWLPLAVVADPTDGKLVHLDGLNISRAWMLEGIASGLPRGDLRRKSLLASAAVHKASGLAAITGAHYAGGHWLGSFATYLQTRRGLQIKKPAVARDAGPQTAVSRLHLAQSRMARFEGRLNAMLSMNPKAEEIARGLDRNPAGVHGPLYGYPVVLKDNIETRDMPTTAGSLALADNFTGRDAELAARLRAAGLVIVGKANLSEWANFRDEHSTSGWSGVDGLTVNAWNTKRTACGSSSGSAVAVAAGYVPFAVGTETNGSVICPASVNGIVGIKPTLGLVSRRGIVPISHNQDTAGPMAINVTAAALLLTAMESEDPQDPVTMRSARYHGRDYTKELRRDGLEGLRIGVVRSQKFHPPSKPVFDRAVADLAAAGAVIVDGLEFPPWPDKFWDNSLLVLETDFKHDLNKYLSGLSGELQDLNLQGLIDFNRQHAKREMPWFKQGLMLASEDSPGPDSDAYKQALQKVQGFTRSTIDGLLDAYHVDVLVLRSNAPAFSIDLVYGDNFQGGASTMAAVAGYPHITVPMGRYKGLPVGLSFVGTAFSEPTLIRAAYAYEQATRHATTLAGDHPWVVSP